MGGFQRVLQSAPTNKPALVITLPPHAFADTWDDKPTEPAQIGIRSLGEKAFQLARQNAARAAWAAFPDDSERELREDAYMDGLMAIAVAQAACLPNDASMPFFGKMAEDVVQIALTTEGVRTVFQGLERLVIGLSPIAPAATDADIAELARIAPDALAKMSEGRQRRLRRLLHHVLVELC